MKFKSFIKECHKRGVFKMLSIYIVSSWVLLQVLAITWQALGLPQNSLTYLIILLLIGFPLYILFLWKYYLQSVEEPLEFEDGETHLTKVGFHKYYFSALGIIVAICFVSIFLIVGNSFSKTSPLPEVVGSGKIAVLQFGNNTGDPKYDIVSKMTADWIIHGILENHLAEVISQDVILQYNAMLKGDGVKRDEKATLKEYLRPSKIISGNFYLNDGALVFNSSITDGKTNDVLISFQSDSCPAENSMKCIMDLQESITGFLAIAETDDPMLQNSPPKYDAYKYLLEAKSTDDESEYISLLNESLEADPSYFEPKVLRVGYYYNIGLYKTADSLLNLIKPDSYNNIRQLNLLNMYEALLQGNNRKAYENMLKEYNTAPFDLKSNRSTMVLAQQFVNRPQDVENIFNVINVDSMDFENCSDCVLRVYVKALADVQMENYSSAIDMIQKVMKETNSELLQKPLVAALIRANKEHELTDFLTKTELTNSQESMQELYLYAGLEYLLKGNKTGANEYFTKVRTLDPFTHNKENLANALFYLGLYSQATSKFEALHKSFPENITYLGKLAMCHAKLGDHNTSERYLNELKQMKNKYQFGEIDYALAQYDAVSKNEDAMYHHLLKSVASGFIFTSKTFQNDPLFSEYMNSSRFHEVLDYWH